MSNLQPIGIFDSGIGGTSIWREVTSLLPKENTIYLADSKNAPYGEKPHETIVKLSIKNTEHLLNQGCKLIIVACNTATTNAIEILRQNYSVPFIGIEPAIKPAALKTITQSIGILATKGTLSSSLFSKTSGEFASNINVIEREGKGIVELIENGKLHSIEMTQLLHHYLNPMLKENIDFLVLGCTHYPYLIPQIQEIIGENVTIIDSGLAVAKQTHAVLEKLNILSSTTKLGNHKFYINTEIEVLQSVLNNTSLSHLIEKQLF